MHRISLVRCHWASRIVRVGSGTSSVLQFFLGWVGAFCGTGLASPSLFLSIPIRIGLFRVGVYGTDSE